MKELQPGPLRSLGNLSLLIGYATFLAGFLGLMIPVAYWRHGASITEAYTTTGGLKTQLVALPLAVLGYRVFRIGASLRLRARKAMAEDAKALMTRDPRPAILYLRSFEHDELAEPSDIRPLNSDPLSGALSGVMIGLLSSAEGAASTQEERLTRYMRRHGPFVAIGDPRDDLPDLGAARLYVDDKTNWKSEVLSLMNKARLVIIRPGLGDGLRWELDRAIQVVPSERVMFWLPGNSDDRSQIPESYEQLKGQLAACVTSPLPKWIEKKPCLCFGSGWTSPHFKRLQDVL